MTAAPQPQPYDHTIGIVSVDGLPTYYFESGSGPTLVLLHGGEFGGCGELSWEYNIAVLSRHHRVVVPDWLGYGRSAKVHDFEDYRLRMVKHLGRLCEILEINDAAFVGNSMGALYLLRDAASDEPELPANSIVAISGGGPVPHNAYRQALTDYDCTESSMQRLIHALFSDPAWPMDPAYVARRYDLSLIPGAWECTASSRFRAPNVERARLAAQESDFRAIKIPTLLIAGGGDKLKPRGYAGELQTQISGSEVLEVNGAGHCPQIEQPEVVNDAILEFVTRNAASW